MLNTMGQTSATNRIVLKVVKGQLNPMPVQCVTMQTLKKTLRKLQNLPSQLEFGVSNQIA